MHLQIADCRERYQLILQTIYHISLSLRETVDTTPSYRQQRQPETGMSMSLPSLPGPVSGSPHWSTIGSDEWLLKSIVLQSWFLAGPFTDRAQRGHFVRG